MKNKAKGIESYIIEKRREIHKYPELGYQEHKTSSLIQTELENMGVSFKKNIAKTGVLAQLQKGEGKHVLLRADMDALPIAEKTNLTFASKNDGLMHACGHDAHIAMLLGVIKLLKDEDFTGTLSFLFQPSEEGNYDDEEGLSGAQRVIKENILDGVDCAIALHQVPDIPTGVIAIDNGTVMAAADLFKISINGKASHAGAYPEKGIDAIIIASQLVTSLQTIISREINAQQTGVISISTINGGTTANIVADSVEMTGTIRALDEKLHQEIIEKIEKRCESYSLMYSNEIEFELLHTVPTTTNNPNVVKIVKESAATIFGENQILKDISTMGGEDFGNISQKIPSCFALLGTKPLNEPTYSLHNEKMIINEQALALGTAYLSQAAIDLLNNFKTDEA
ncbi:N-acetyl-L,L-diaminopimelate deacetylase [hydrothermal vent metagenome]|uniref:N-acetyl-L,L-diaminopimelate deacetylase n=1 Tax=hydrothermal vent metagenome TaxID=652676 RepID=A0A1W1EEG7_9ZZZZ